MALIKCPECEETISDKAKVCIHCGYPISEHISSLLEEVEYESENFDDSEDEEVVGICAIDGVKYNLSDFKDFFFNEERNKGMTPFGMSRWLSENIPELSLDAAQGLVKIIQETGEIPSEFSIDGFKTKEAEEEERRKIYETKWDNLVHCPRCDSTQIVTGQRGYSLMWGFLGSNKTMNRCASCGYKWEPRKW